MTMTGMVNSVQSAYGIDGADWPRLAAAMRAAIDCAIPEEDVPEPELENIFADAGWALQSARRTYLYIVERLEASK